MSYAQRRQISGGPSRSAQNGNQGTPLSGQSSWGGAATQSESIFDDTGSQARAALAQKEKAGKLDQDAFSEAYASKRLFAGSGQQTTRNGNARVRDAEPSKPPPITRHIMPSRDPPFAIPGNAQRNSQQTARSNQERRSNNQNEPRQHGRDRTGQRSRQSKILTEVQGQKAATPTPRPSFMPTQQKGPQAKVQAPSWIKSPSQAAATPAASSWGVSPPAVEDRDVFNIQSSEQQQSDFSDPFGGLDATRQALLQGQEEQSRPLQRAMSAMRTSQAARGDQPSRRDNFNAPRGSDHQSRADDVFAAPSQGTRQYLAGAPGKPSQGRAESPLHQIGQSIVANTKKPEAAAQDIQDARQSSTLSADEERMLQDLLARRSGTSQGVPPQSAPAQTSEPQTVTYSPFGDGDQSARSALASQSASSLAETRAKEHQIERKQRYKITMAEDNPFARDAEPFDPQVSSTWNILNRRRQQNQQDQQEPTPERRSYTRTPEDIDAKFQEYRSRRPSNVVDMNGIPDAPERRGLPPIRRSPSVDRMGSMKCVRCGEEGHMAFECSNPPMMEKRKCLNCGKAGHLARLCPEPRGVSKSQGPYRDFVNDTREVDQKVAGFRTREGFVGAGSRRPMQDREKKEEEEEEEEDEDGEPLTRQEKRARKFTATAPPEPAEETGRTRSVRRSRFAEDDEGVEKSEKATKPRRSRFNEDEDERPSRGRRSRNDDENEPSLSYEDFEGARERRNDRKKARQAKKDKAAKEAARIAARAVRKSEELTSIQLPEFISVSNLAQTLNVRYEDFVTKMEELGFTNHSHDHILSAENASLIAMEYNFDATIGEGQEAEERDLRPRPEVTDKEFLPTRPPVVAIMGHVDHGKTTILDFLRKSSVAASEHGGITQHIGAFSVGLSSGRTITFLDTPGHAAFLEMRKRGATVTDIIILVVAADDSVKPQTIEAIKHAKAANVPIIVAINKIDKEEANIDRVKQDLARHEVEIEDFGGDTQVVPVSGKTGAGIDELENNIVALSEILDHRAETDGAVEGWVLEATTKKAGRVATVLVRRGTLKTGDILVAGKTWTRVRTLRNEAGAIVATAGPGTPVEVDGWKEQPTAGDEALQAPNEQKAVAVIDYRAELDERTKMAEDMEAINSVRRLEAEKRVRDKAAAEAAAKAAAAGETEGGDGAATSASKTAAAEDERAADELNATPGHQTVPFIIKADVSGSVEAVSAYLLQMSNPLCSPTLLRASVGPVSEFDVEHAAAADGHIIAFNLPHAPEMMGQADKRNVRLIEENVIYRIVNDVKAVLEAKLPPLKSQRVVGEADIAVGFEIGVGGRKKLRIAGCKVRNGMIARGSRVRVLRGERKVYDGVLSSLKNVKKDVQEMRKGTECGMGFDDWEEFEVGDQIQTYEEKVEKRTLQI